MSAERPFATGRLFIRGVKRAEWPVERASVFDTRAVMERLWRDFPEMPEAPHMIEIEFHGFPENERFSHFGTDRRMMVAPVEIAHETVN